MSSAALIGGGSAPRPDEISLAHNGVLFLDELPELARAAVEGLRPLRELRRAEPGESSAPIRARVAAARDRQLARLRPWNLRCNAEMPSAVLRATCKLDSLGERTLAELVERRKTATARSVDRLIKVARTIADLLGQDDIDAGCLLEAAGYRDVDPIADP